MMRDDAAWPDERDSKGERGSPADPSPPDERVLVEEVLPAHGLIPPLTAADHDRYAYVIEGHLAAWIGRSVMAGPGSIVAIPRGASASLWNPRPRECGQTELVVVAAGDGGSPRPLAIEPAACGPDTRIAVLHVWEGADPGAVLAAT